MKNIWKFMLIAMMAIAMVGCPTGGDDDDNTPPAPSTFNGSYKEWPAWSEAVSSTGIYEVKLNKSQNIDGQWGGTASAPTVKVVLVPSGLAKAIYVDKTIATDGELFMGENAVLVYPATKPKNHGNGSFSWLTADDTENYTVIDALDVRLDGFIAGKPDASGDYTFLINLNKFTKDNLGVKYDDFEKKDAVSDAAAEALAADLSDYVPLILGSVTAAFLEEDQHVPTEYDFEFWNAGVLQATPSTKTWPADADIKGSDEAPVSTADFSNVTAICGTITGWKHTPLDANGELYFTNDATADYKFTDGSWADAGQAGSPDGNNGSNPNYPSHLYDAFAPVNLEKTPNATKIDYGKALFEAGKIYKIKLTKTDDSATATIEVTDKTSYTASATFDTDGGSAAPAAITVTLGTEFTLPAEPTKDGFTFVEWAIVGGDIKGAAGAKLTLNAIGSLAFKAIWKANSTTPVISTITDIADATTDVAFTIEATITAPTDKTGCTYAWYEIESAEKPATDGEAITGATTATLTTTKATAGDYYFYLKVTNTETDKAAASAYSNVVKVTVAE